MIDLSLKLKEDVLKLGERRVQSCCCLLPPDVAACDELYTLLVAEEVL